MIGNDAGIGLVGVLTGLFPGLKPEATLLEED